MVLFAIFEKQHISAHEVFFRSSIPKYGQILLHKHRMHECLTRERRTSGKVFILKKFTRTLKIYKYFWGNSKKPSLYSTSKNKHQKENLKLKFVKYLLLFSQNGQNSFLFKENNIFFIFSSFLTLKKIKVYIPPCCSLYQFFEIFVVANFRVTFNIY